MHSGPFLPRLVRVRTLHHDDAHRLGNMRYAVISDIHANLEALQAALTKIASLGADRVFCLGDVVGYGADPNECVEIVRHEGIQCILGNHDVAASGLEEPDDFNPLARRAVLWTRQQLTEENKAFLRGLPRELAVDGVLLFHGFIHDTNRYLMTREDCLEGFRLMEALPAAPAAGFFGHTHVKVAVSLFRGAVALEPADRLALDAGKRYLINPGSVGQPRDRDPRAAFAVYDTAERMVTFSRAEYDIRVCQDKIIQAGLPPRLAERLAQGW